MIQDIYSIRIKKSFILLVFLITSFSIAEAKTLYVNGTTGSDSTTYANNDIGHPWATLGRATWGSTSRISPNASQAAKAGDTVLVAAGTYHNGNATGEARTAATLEPANTGTLGYPITFRCVTAGACILTHTGTGSASGSPIIGAHAGSYYTWDGFKINTINAQNHTGPSAGGIFSFEGGSRGGMKGIIIKNFTVDSTGMTYAGGDNYPIIWAQNVAGLTIQNNELMNHHTASGTDENVPALTTYYCDNVLVENNNIHDIDNGLYIKGGANTNVIVRYNLFYNNTLHIRWQYTNSGSVYQNIMRDCVNYPMRITDQVHNLSVYNNTVDTCQNGFSFNQQANNGTNNILRNNIVTNTVEAINAGDVGSLPGWTINYNNYYTFTYFSIAGLTYSTIAAWRAATPFDDNSITTNPLYVDGPANNFRLQAGSPARTASDTGGPVGAYITGNEIIGFTSTPNGGTQVLSVPPIQSVN